MFILCCDAGEYDAMVDLQRDGWSCAETFIEALDMAHKQFESYPIFRYIIEVHPGVLGWIHRWRLNNGVYEPWED